MQPSIWSEFKKYLGDALPGGALNPELTTNINESPVPVGMAALRSFLGEAPDELGVSVLHPQRAAIMRVANPAFAAGTALSVTPVMGGLSALKASKGATLSAAPKNVEGALSRQAGVFVGPRSKTWDAAAAQRAAEMETAGIDPRSIWRETGTWRGPEGGLESLRRAAQSIWENVMRDPKDKLMYRGVKPVSESDLRSAVRKVRPNSLSGSEWWSDNPLIASSYGPFVRTSRLSRDPELVLSAGGRNWDDYFLMPSQTGPGYSVQAGLRPGAFRSGFESPTVRDIMVQHVQDAGPHSWPRYNNLEKEFEDLSGLPSTWSNNLLIKRGSDVLVPVSPTLYARGGLAQLKECSCGR